MGTIPLIETICRNLVITESNISKATIRGNIFNKSSTLYDIVEPDFPNSEDDIPRFADGHHTQPSQGRDERGDVRTRSVSFEGTPRNPHGSPSAGRDGEGISVG